MSIVDPEHRPTTSPEPTSGHTTSPERLTKELRGSHTKRLGLGVNVDLKDAAGFAKRLLMRLETGGSALLSSSRNL